MEKNLCVNCGNINGTLGTYRCNDCGAYYCSDCVDEIREDGEACVEWDGVDEHQTMLCVSRTFNYIPKKK